MIWFKSLSDGTRIYGSVYHKEHEFWKQEGHLLFLGPQKDMGISHFAEWNYYSLAMLEDIANATSGYKMRRVSAVFAHISVENFSSFASTVT